MSEVQALGDKLGCVKSLVCRNKIRKPNKTINFPFLVVEFSEEKDTDIRIKAQWDFGKALLNSNREFKVYGDLEVLTQIPSVWES